MATRRRISRALRSLWSSVRPMAASGASSQKRRTGDQVRTPAGRAARTRIACAGRQTTASSSSPISASTHWWSIASMRRPAQSPIVATSRRRPAAGPRHFVFNPNGRFVYVVQRAEEIDRLPTLRSMPPMPRSGWWAPRSRHCRRKRPGNSCSAIQISSNGAHLFVGNRVHDSVARFAIDANGIARFLGTTPCGGQIPRDFAFDPSGRVLAVRQ